MAQLKFVRVLQVFLLSFLLTFCIGGFSTSNYGLVEEVQARAKFDPTTVSENSLPL